MTETTAGPKASDLLSVKSRVSWGAIAAGAMVSLAIYLILTLLGLALSIEVAVRGTEISYSGGAAIYAILTLLLAMFFGGWTTSRLAVGESKLEAILYGIILWGVLFAGLIWLFSAGLQTGYGALVGVASGANETGAGETQSRLDPDQLADMMKKAGVEDATVNKTRDYYQRAKNDPVSTAREVARDPEARGRARSAAWWTLLGVLASMATVIVGSLTGSGEMLQPMPILGVKRTRPTDPRI